MDLTERLTEAVEQIPGAVAISLLGLDGVAVETIHGSKPLVGTNRASRDGDSAMEAWEVEVADLMQGSRRAARGLNWGALKQMTLETQELTFMLRMVKSEYFLLLAVENEANAARARYELQRLATSLGEDL
jgi:predicted regulator of Ras-like GTPase activity (Roadblock/LC7/MglB family)